MIPWPSRGTGQGGPRPVALLYRRVSTDEQARDGMSLLVQAADTRGYAARHAWAVAGEFEDVLSGTTPDRPGYQRLLAEVRRLRRARASVVVVVRSIDRFGRSVVEQARRAEEFRRLGIVLHAVSEGGAVPEVIGNVLAAVAEHEARRIGDQTRDRHRAVRAAGWSQPQRPPWGYRFRPATAEERAEGAPRRVLEPDPTEAPAVQEAWAQVAGGATLLSVAQWARALPDAARGRRRFSYTTIRNLFYRAVYIGRTGPRRPHALSVLSEPVMRGPALVDDATWRAVHLRLSRRSPTTAAGPPALLSGVLRCPSCGGRMALCRPKKPGTALRYGCRAYVSGGLLPERRCGQSATLAQVDALVVREVTGRLRALARSARPASQGVASEPPSTAAIRARRDWTRAALRLVDGLIDTSSYARVRERARGAIRAGTPPSPQGDSGGDACEDGWPGRVVSDWERALRHGDRIGQRTIINMVVRQVVPVRVRHATYQVTIDWAYPDLGAVVGRSLPSSGRAKRVSRAGGYDRNRV